MGKKIMKFPFLSKINNTDYSRSSTSSSNTSSSWPWPAYCQQPKTLSFRTGDNMFKTLNSAYNLEPNLDAAADRAAESWFTSTSESASFSTASIESGGESIETVIRGLRSDRLFFKPGETSSILEEAHNKGGDVADADVDADEFLFKESVVMSMDSQDPYVDFKKSMEEMVEAHGLKDWDSLEELLCCYLKVNGKNNHGYIIGAFIDLLVNLAFASATTATANAIPAADSPSSPLSFYTSSNFSDDSSSTPCISSLEADEEEIHLTPCLSSLEAENEIKENQKQMINASSS